jgi:hypothetical protein
MFSANKIKIILTITAIFLFSGCAISSLSTQDRDNDGVPDFKDVCKHTPIGAQVDKHGCALDSDFDGVIDLYDKCPNTTASELVNPQGCTVKEL